jgi:hypothetical protein
MHVTFVDGLDQPFAIQIEKCLRWWRRLLYSLIFVKVQARESILKPSGLLKISGCLVLCQFLCHGQGTRVRVLIRQCDLGNHSLAARSPEELHQKFLG